MTIIKKIARTKRAGKLYLFGLTSKPVIVDMELMANTLFESPTPVLFIKFN